MAGQGQAEGRDATNHPINRRMTMKIALSATHLIAAGVIATAFAIGFLSGPAFAGEPQADADQFEFRFDFDRSELGSAESAKLMLDRLERKVRRHCDDGGRKSVAERPAVS